MPFDNKENKQNDNERKAVEKVERMNRIFDKYIVPLLIFCAAATILSSLVLGSSCSGCVPGGSLGMSDYYGMYDSVSDTQTVSQTDAQ